MMLSKANKRENRFLLVCPAPDHSDATKPSEGYAPLLLGLRSHGRLGSTANGA